MRSVWTRTRHVTPVTLTALLACSAPQVAPSPDQTPTPPEQPISGPGGKTFLHKGITASRLGSGTKEVYLFEPDDPASPTAPVVVFGHGWAGTNPNIYGAWIAHIVRRGFIVVFPRYQADLRTPVGEFSRNALAATQQALDELRSPGHVTPDERGLVFVGHSMGGLVAANLTASAARGELPPPLALMAVQPGRTWPEGSAIAFPLDDLSQLPAKLLLVTVVGDDDDVVGDVDARKIYTSATAVPSANKNYVRMLSDDRGSPALASDHRAPAAPGTLVAEVVPARVQRGASLPSPRLNGRGPMVVDAVDYYGTWKLLDGLLDAVFRGVHREFALGDTPEQRFMGRWSDGVNVRELRVEEP